MTNGIPPDYLVLCAGLIYIVGLLIIDQLVLRCMLLVGSVFYVWYYATVNGEPMWAAIVTNLAISSANAIGLGLLLLRNSKLSIPHRHADIYEMFSILPPGDFRKLMSAATRSEVAHEFRMTVEGEPVRTLYFVLRGEVTAAKRGETFPLPAGIFLGEVGYLTGNAASATTTLDAGGELIQWDVATLKRMCARSPRFNLALDAAISKDLAAKVALAGAPGHGVETGDASWRSLAASGTV